MNGSEVLKSLSANKIAELKYKKSRLVNRSIGELKPEVLYLVTKLHKSTTDRYGRKSYVISLKNAEEDGSEEYRYNSTKLIDIDKIKRAFKRGNDIYLRYIGEKTSQYGNRYFDCELIVDQSNGEEELSDNDTPAVITKNVEPPTHQGRQRSEKHSDENHSRGRHNPCCRDDPRDRYDSRDRDRYDHRDR